jgi:hypothetical protein
MTDAAAISRPSHDWKKLSAERRLAAAEAFWHDENGGAEQAEAITIIAQRIKFRTKSVIAMPVEKKARHLVALPAVSESVAARLIVAYHLAHQRPMMGRFLDALGIAHENGLIADEKVEPVAKERLAAAVKTLAELSPPEDVSLYLSTLLWQDPDTWGALSELPEGRGTAAPSTT